MRPLTALEKQERRDALANQAAELFSAVGYARLTVDAVARAAGVAKGTVFLSFASKEDLVLHAVGLRFDAWLERLVPLDPTQPPAAMARAIVDGLKADPLLLPLLALVGPVLEQGCSPEAVIRFKEALAVQLEVLGRQWGSRYPAISAETWSPLFLRVYALIVGAWAVGETSAVARQALVQRPDLQGLLTTFDDLLVPMLEAQLRSILVP